jgi:hypothetical protein
VGGDGDRGRELIIQASKVQEIGSERAREGGSNPGTRGKGGDAICVS